MGLLARMSAALNVYNALKSEQQRGKATLTEWSRSNPAAWHVVARIEKMRRNQDG